MTRTSAPPCRTLLAERNPRVAGTAETNDPATVDAVAAALEARFGSSLTPALRRQIADQAIDHYRNAPIQSFVTILAQRLAVDLASQRLPPS